MGRLFLALYKTPDLEAFIRKKITKKISRVKKPNFITKISLQKIDAGEGAPLITNPRLRDLTIDGDCCVEADVNYSGNFRLEVMATARIELGTRFKPREVDLILAVVLKSLKGHGLLRFKPPPSNRLWVSFETMPVMEMSIEPIVSSRQITYGVILRAIESRIREVVAETLVLPFWDDIPFLDTEHEIFRGGIWHHSQTPPPKTVIPDETAEQPESSDQVPSLMIDVPSSKNDVSMNSPSMPGSPPPALTGRRGSKSMPSQLGELGPSVSSSVDKTNHLDPPRAIRSQTFSHVADPIVTADTVNVDQPAWDSKMEERDATATMIEISNRSQPNSPAGTPVGSPPKEPYSLHRRSVARKNSVPSDETRPIDIPPRTPSTRDGASSATLSTSNSPHSSNLSLRSETTKQTNLSGSPPRIDASNNKGPERQVIGSIGSAAAAARKWGLNVLKRNGESFPKGDNKPPMPDHPIGRGRPSHHLALPCHRPIERPQKDPRPVPKPPLPRRNISTTGNQEPTSHDLLIIEAPLGSEPSTPVTDSVPGNYTVTINGNDIENDLPSIEHNDSTLANTESPGPESSEDRDSTLLEDDLRSTGAISMTHETISTLSAAPTPNEHIPDPLLHS
ncbi:hypothetical protein ACJ72_06873 [Emergomyces africanus]|uniref:SMP-LTD domain-containing protein n=1 Tax=Emergomyces africanus TaxID=1955775 RepID=A0A1B7NPR5_9EURO|nr:hypothetical protein ACJ72_06873 [Emergomyces africanus]